MKRRTKASKSQRIEEELLRENEDSSHMVLESLHSGISIRCEEPDKVNEMEIYQYEENADPLQFDDTWAGKTKQSDDGTHGIMHLMRGCGKGASSKSIVKRDLQ
ncbi:hypothetical protein ACSQ67_001751 [Phaseolus vulgaris]